MKIFKDSETFAICFFIACVVIGLALLYFWIYQNWELLTKP